MRLLVLGGTIFLGRHVVEEAIRRGHDVTVFHRGRHGADLFPQVRRVLGDRDGGLAALGGADWDAVVDTCGYVPRVVALSAECLSAHCGLYVFISSVSAYSDLSHPGTDETAPLARLEDATTEEINGETYGPLKAACEAVVQRVFDSRALVVRPGLIVGPWDPSDRFTYWPVRLSHGGEVLAPGTPERPVQFIDVRDLAVWLVTRCEQGAGGVYNAVGPASGATFGDLLEACRKHSPAGTRLTWVEDQFLLANEVQPWSDLPMWLPSSGEYAGLDTVDGSRAWRAGLKTRDIAKTVEDTLAWFRAERPGGELRAGILDEREQELLSAWHRQRSAA